MLSDSNGHAPELCHCGKPLHYTDPITQAMVQEMVNRLGAYMPVKLIGSGRAWLVQRHYVALHGIKASELPYLGFEEVPRQGGPEADLQPGASE